MQTASKYYLFLLYKNADWEHGRDWNITGMGDRKYYRQGRSDGSRPERIEPPPAERIGRVQGRRRWGRAVRRLEGGKERGRAVRRLEGGKERGRAVRRSEGGKERGRTVRRSKGGKKEIGREGEGNREGKWEGRARAA
ncbi:hypothetical protein ACLOJK_025757 [Asimina triloba]